MGHYRGGTRTCGELFLFLKPVSLTSFLEGGGGGGYQEGILDVLSLSRLSNTPFLV
jgi:hypothetical protein